MEEEKIERMSLREEEINGVLHFFNSKNQRVTSEGILIRPAEETEKIDYSTNGVNTSFQNLSIPG